MPYTGKQCRKFGVMSRQGKRVPTDFRKHCRRKKQGKQKR